MFIIFASTFIGILPPSSHFDRLCIEITHYYCIIWLAAQGEPTGLTRWLNLVKISTTCRPVCHLVYGKEFGSMRVSDEIIKAVGSFLVCVGGFLIHTRGKCAMDSLFIYDTVFSSLKIVFN